MADQRYLAAFLTPASTLVCGRSLKPFCLKHRLFLEGIESPFLREEAEITAPDIILALKVCADDPIDKPTWADIWLGVRFSLSKDYQKRAALAVIRHITTQVNFPKFWERTDRKTYGTGSVPWQLTLIANLLKNGVTYSEAMTMPEAKAVWLSAVFSIQTGAKIEFLSTDDESLIDDLAKVEAPPKQNGK